MMVTPNLENGHAENCPGNPANEIGGVGECTCGWESLQRSASERHEEQQAREGRRDDPKLAALIAKAVEMVKCMSPEELEDMLAKQCESWERGEMAMGESVCAARQRREGGAPPPTTPQDKGTEG